MTVTAAEARVEYAGNGSTTIFAYPHQFYQNSDLEIWLFNNTTGDGVLQIVGHDYTVTGAMNVTGGNITMTVAPPAGTTLIIINDPDIVQQTHYVNADDFPADSHEAALDRLTKICQRLSDRVDRAVRAPDYSPEDQVPDADTLVNLVEDATEAANESAASASAAANSAGIASNAAATAVSAANTATSAAASADASADAAAASEAAAAESATEAQVNEINWRGNWSASATYDAHDAVAYAGSSYISKNTHTNMQPDTHPANWDVLAQKGGDGAPGSGTGDMLRANNLSDVVSTTAARTNLGLGGAATLNVGTTASTVAAGNDPRIVGAAPLASPGLTGNPTAPTPAPGDNDTSIATTGFVFAAVAAGLATVPPVASAAEYLLGTSNAKTVAPKTAWDAAAPVVLAAVANVATPDMSAGIDFVWTLGAAGQTLANPNAPKPGQKGILYLAQDGTGGRTITTWGSAWKFPGGTKPTLSTAASALDVVSYAVLSSGVIACTFQGGLA